MPTKGIQGATLDELEPFREAAQKESIIFSSNALYVKYVWDGQIVGFASVVHRGPVSLCKSLWVSPAFRGRGIGAELIDWQLRQSVGRRAEANCTPASLGLYKKAGFLPVHRYKNGLTKAIFDPALVRKGP